MRELHAPKVSEVVNTKPKRNIKPHNDEQSGMSQECTRLATGSILGESNVGYLYYTESSRGVEVEEKALKFLCEDLSSTAIMVRIARIGRVVSSSRMTFRSGKLGCQVGSMPTGGT